MPRSSMSRPIVALPVVVGFVSIPPSGGHDHQDLDQPSTSLVSGGTSVSDSAGTVLVPAATRRVSPKRNCLRAPVNGSCTGRQRDHFASNSSSGRGISSSDAQALACLDFSVGGTSVSDNPPPQHDCPVARDRIGHPQRADCDGGGAPPCSGTTSSVYGCARSM